MVTSQFLCALKLNFDFVEARILVFADLLVAVEHKMILPLKAFASLVSAAFLAMLQLIFAFVTASLLMVFVVVVVVVEQKMISPLEALAS